MRYFGGKARIGKKLAEYIQPRLVGKVAYWEPFCGGCSVIEHVVHDNRIATDLHQDLILMWQALQQGWEPPTEVSEELYQSLKKAEPSPLRGFVGFGCSNSGKFFGGYARDNTSRNYAQNAFNGVVKKIERLQEVVFEYGAYDMLTPENFLIYCDPPYAKTTGFTVGAFDSEKFWDWVRLMAKTNLVLVSEYTAPDDFISVWEKPVKTDMKKADNTKHSRIEKLFQYRR